MLGGAPVCDKMVPFVRPALPSADSMMPLVREMIEGGQLTKGEYLEAFESAVAHHLGVKHAIGVSSCTTGLMLAYRALRLDAEVVVPSFTFMATVSALVWAGLKPVFADIEFDTATVDLRAVERAITPRTSAIVGVHTFGNPAGIDGLRAIADRHRLSLVFDSAHGFGSLYRGVPVGSQGDCHVFSLSPTKLLVAGEGGIVATNDDAVARRVRLGREYGNDGSYDSLFAGMNGRMAEFNALLGLQGLPILESVARQRNLIADAYRAQLAEIPGIEPVTVKVGNRSSYKDFSIAIDPAKYGLNRDQLAVALKVEQIDTRKYFYPAVHRQTAYASLHTGSDPLAQTDLLAERSLSLPMGTQVSLDLVSRVSNAIRRLHRHARDVRLKLSSDRGIVSTPNDPMLVGSLLPSP